MRLLSNAHNAAHLPHRHGHDTGTAADSRRFFSSDTRWEAEHHSDFSWMRVLTSLVGAVMLVITSLVLGRVEALGGVAVLLLLVGVVWTGLSLRVTAIKLTTRKAPHSA
ncbi:MAG TPA: hypothetical protein DCQ53_04160 [Alphaproteobacteria bacterium]|jgi:Ca2+/Na+ antiporter|nr:hypothetical protein [Alphaproteobacteria bacterium]|tara:strand:+ start:141 stop:467 length:327 start_codon:yes stop_codon:yes gene_type:complete